MSPTTSRRSLKFRTGTVIVRWADCHSVGYDREKSQSDVAGGPGAKGHFSLKAAAEEHPHGPLDFLVSVGVDDGIDHGVVGSGEQRGVRVHGRVVGIPHYTVDGKRQPAGPESPEDYSKGGDPLFGGNVV